MRGADTIFFGVVLFIGGDGDQYVAVSSFTGEFRVRLWPYGEDSEPSDHGVQGRLLCDLHSLSAPLLN